MAIAKHKYHSYVQRFTRMHKSRKAYTGKSIVTEEGFVINVARIPI